MTLKQLLLTIKIQNLNNTPAKEFRYLSVTISNLRKIVKSMSEETLLKIYTPNRKLFPNISKVGDNYSFNPINNWNGEYDMALRYFIKMAERI